MPALRLAHKRPPQVWTGRDVYNTANHLIGNRTVAGSIRGSLWSAHAGLFWLDHVVDQVETIDGVAAAVAAFFPTGVVWG
jgi:hypothetical protein